MIVSDDADNLSIACPTFPLSGRPPIEGFKERKCDARLRWLANQPHADARYGYFGESWVVERPKLGIQAQTPCINHTSDMFLSAAILAHTGLMIGEGNHRLCH